MAYVTDADETFAGDSNEGCLLFSIALIAAAVMVLITGVALLTAVH